MLFLNFLLNLLLDNHGVHVRWVHVQARGRSIAEKAVSITVKVMTTQVDP